MIKRIYKKLKRKVKIFTGSVTYLKKEVEFENKWYGNSYGGFYVSPDSLNKNSIVYSFGIGEDISFDRAIIKNHECKVFAFDPTPKSIEWVRKQHLPSTFTFFDYGINSKTGFVNFNLPKNKEHVSGSVIKHQNVDKDDFVQVSMKCFADITKELGHGYIDLLKMDIEGSEYEIIDNILTSPIQVNQILLELNARVFVDGTEKTTHV
ncbi:FkbM family methyltransferase, partial [Arachidicoccus sp.]|uniref:FkbM family methyltransferase n=1 Tax=Arachidicoccus sp. TaxID=1872624 RepID=UPI003D20E67B